MLQEFLDYLNSKVGKNIYCWGGQGQTASEELIRKMENSKDNADRAIKYFRSLQAKGIKDIKMFDCSGLGMYWLQNVKAIYKHDMTADAMKKECKIITKAELKKGDWVFKCGLTGKATHIGYVVDDALNVVESQGRDYGVVRRPLSAGGWNKFGRPNIFADEINKIVRSWTCSRLLYLTSPMMKGDDVKTVQTKLNSLGYACGTADGAFGKNTQNAVKAFQRAKKLKADGVVGKDTVTALGGKWL